MFNDLKIFLSKYASFTDDDWNEITSRFTLKEVRRNDILLKEGAVCKDLVFVRKGCLRLYYIKDDIEVSVWFSFAQSSAIEVYSFISGNPSSYFMEATEDSELLSIPKQELEKIYISHPHMLVLMKNFWEDVLLTLINRFTALQTNSAEERYLDLLSKPDYMQSIPLKYLASFIGVTPTSLSRIRKQLSEH